MPLPPSRLLGAALGLPTVAAGVVLLGFGLPSLIRSAMRPDGAFADAPPPSAPDYADPAAWSALPDRDDAADLAPPGLPAADPRSAVADVFYVHPTSYVGSAWNGPVDDPRVNAGTDAGSTRVQATAFAAAGAVYAPRYRQANGTQFLEPSADGARAFDVAYADVERAFDHFQARRGADRPFLLAAHSQGSILLQRLLAERVSGTPLREQLVAAWIPGGTLTAAGLAESMPDLPACAAPTDVGCVVAWHARGPDYVPSGFDPHRDDPRPLLCVNPLSWRTDDAPARDTLGAVFLDSDDPSPRPGFAEARCADGVLVTTLYGKPPRDFMSRILDRVMGAGNHHPVEYQLFWASIRQNALDRVAAWQARRGATAPAAPAP